MFVISFNQIISSVYTKNINNHSPVGDYILYVEFRPIVLSGIK